MVEALLHDGGLVVRDLRKHFGGVQAVRGISFAVQPGECVALIGPNGAGKSTTFACIAGQHAPDAGQVLWQGARMDGLSPAQRLQRGMARSFQVAQTFEALTVLQNVQLLLPGASQLSPLQVLNTVAPQRALALLARMGLQEQAGLVAGTLPYGAKKRLELAMALAGLEEPMLGQQLSGVLLLDEPAAGLAAAERAALMQTVHALTRAGASGKRLAVLYTEHNMDAVFGVADRVLVLMEGAIAAEGTAAEIAANPQVRKHYLGESFNHAAQESRA